MVGCKQNEKFIKIMWRDTAIVQKFDHREHEWVDDYEIVKCHLSFQRPQEAGQTDSKADAVLRVVLFCDAQLDIKVGSRIVVTTRQGKKYECETSGISASYDWHQEITLKKAVEA